MYFKLILLLACLSFGQYSSKQVTVKEDSVGHTKMYIMKMDTNYFACLYQATYADVLTRLAKAKIDSSMLVEREKQIEACDEQGSLLEEYFYQQEKKDSLLLTRDSLTMLKYDTMYTHAVQYKVEAEQYKQKLTLFTIGGYVGGIITASLIVFLAGK